MKKMLLSVLTFVCVMSSVPLARAADTYTEFGQWVSEFIRYGSWSVNKLPKFEKYFADRITKNSSDYEACISHAFILVAQLAENKTFQAYMERFGFEIDYFDLSFDGSATDPLTWPDPNELVDAAVSECEPQLNAALNDLKAIPSGWKGSVLLPADVFGFNDNTFFESDVYVDEADVLAARALIEETLGLLYFLKGYDLPVDWDKASIMTVPSIPMLASAPSISSTTGWSGALTIPAQGDYRYNGPQGYFDIVDAPVGVQFALNGSSLYIRMESDLIDFIEYDDNYSEDLYFDVENPADGQRYHISVNKYGNTSIFDTNYDSCEHASSSLYFENGTKVVVVDLSGTQLDGARSTGLFLVADKVGMHQGRSFYQDGMWHGYEYCDVWNEEHVYDTTKFWADQPEFMASVRYSNALAKSKDHMSAAFGYAIAAYSAALNRPADGHYHFIEYDPAYSEELAKAANVTRSALTALTTATKFNVAEAFDLDLTFLPGGGLFRVYLGALFNGKLVRDSLPFASSVDKCGNLELHGKIKDPTVNGVLPDFTETAWGLLWDKGFGCPNDIPGSVIWRAVTFNAAGGSVSERSRAVRDGMQMGALPTPVRTGYSFTGWYTASSGGYLVSQNTVVNSDITLYARWALKTYTLSFYPNGGTYRSTTGTYVIPNDSQTIAPTYGKGYHWRVGAATRAGYTFKGWYTSATSNVQVFNANGDAVSGAYWSASGSGATWKYDGNVSVYAQWKPNTYTLTLDPNGGTYKSKTAAHVIPNDSQTTKPTYGKGYYWSVGVATRAGYTFDGWYTTKSGGDKVYDANGEAVSGTCWTGSGRSATWNRAANLTVYARWTPKTYTLTLDPNGGTYRSSEGSYVIPNSSQTKEPTYGKGYYWRVGVATRKGYTFKGWYTSKTSGTQVYDANGEAVSGAYWSASGSGATWKRNGNVKLYAQWKPITRKIKFYPNGGDTAKLSGEVFGAADGKNKTATLTVTYDSSTNSVVGRARRAGHYFQGWFTDRSGGTRIYDSNGKAIAGNYWKTVGSEKKWQAQGTTELQLYAQWKKASTSSK